MFFFLEIAERSIRNADVDSSFTDLSSPTQLTETPEKSRQTGNAAE